MRDVIEQIKDMEVGKVLIFPKELRSKINNLITRLFCHGKTFIVRNSRENDYVTVKRIE